MGIRKFTLIFEVSILLFVLSSVSACTLLQKVDPDFKDDIMNGPEDFPFDPNKLPVIGVTTEEDLKRMYPKPSRRWTFKKPIPKEIMGEKFNMDEVVSYYNFKTEKISGPGVSGYVGKDYLYFNIFLERGIVRQYLIHHVVKEESHIRSPWIKGKYTREPKDLPENRSWPDERIDAECYWLQRRDRWNYFHTKNDINRTCPYWDPVPAWEK